MVKHDLPNPKLLTLDPLDKPRAANSDELKALAKWINDEYPDDYSLEDAEGIVVEEAQVAIFERGKWKYMVVLYRSLTGADTFYWDPQGEFHNETQGVDP